MKLKKKKIEKKLYRTQYMIKDRKKRKTRINRNLKSNLQIKSNKLRIEKKICNKKK